MKGRIASTSVVPLLLAGCCLLLVVSQVQWGEMAAYLGLVEAPGSQEPLGGPAPADVRGTIILDEGLFLIPEQQELIRNYMDAYFRSLAALEVDYPHELFAGEAEAQAAADKAVWEIAAAVRNLQPVDLQLDSYSYEMVCTGIAQEETGDVGLELTENNVQNFRQYPGVDAESGGIEHQFTLTQADGVWYIKDHRRSGTLCALLMGSDGECACFSVPDVTGDARTVKDQVIADARENLRRTAAGEGGAAGGDRPSFEHAYRREAATAYAHRWSLERNPQWPAYDDEGGNCANFTSQCLLAGGIPMDPGGVGQWKWYGEKYNPSQTAYGRSASWASVSSFYKYALINRGQGLVAQVDADFYTGEPGDILQLGFLQEWRHNVIITEVINDESGRTIDYLVSSNTEDQRNFPVSAYVYTMRRLIKIHGWNE